MIGRHDPTASRSAGDPSVHLAAPSPPVPMARVSTYLNFPRNTEEAFNFYKSVFRTEFAGPIARFKDIPPQPGQPPMAEADKNLVMHVSCPSSAVTC